MSLPTITTIRSQIYSVLDTLIKTGKPVRFTYKGYILRIVVEEKLNKLANLKKRAIYRVDPDELENFKVWKSNE